MRARAFSGSCWITSSSTTSTMSSSSRRRSSRRWRPDVYALTGFGRSRPSGLYHRSPMAEFDVDPYAGLYARRTSGMSASEVRALFAVAARPDVISLAGGMPFVQALPSEEVLRVVTDVLERRSAVALQYGGGSGQQGLKERLVGLMAEEGTGDVDPDLLLITVGAQQALDLV